MGGGHPILVGHRYRSRKCVFNKSPNRPMEHPNIPVFPSHKEPHCWLQKEPGVSSNHFTPSPPHPTHFRLLGPNTAPREDLEMANVGQLLGERSVEVTLEIVSPHPLQLSAKKGGQGGERGKRLA